jgi:tellurite resistance protein
MANSEHGGIGGIVRGIRDTFGSLFGGKLDANEQLAIEVLFGLLGLLARADSIVTTHETGFVNALMDELDLPLKGREIANAAFDRGRHRQVTIVGELTRFLGVYRNTTDEATRLYDTLLRLAASDDRLRPQERVFLEEVTTAMGYPLKALDERLSGLRTR